VTPAAPAAGVTAFRLSPHMAARCGGGPHAADPPGTPLATAAWFDSLRGTLRAPTGGRATSGAPRPSRPPPTPADARRPVCRRPFAPSRRWASPGDLPSVWVTIAAISWNGVGP